MLLPLLSPATPRSLRPCAANTRAPPVGSNPAHTPAIRNRSSAARAGADRLAPRPPVTVRNAGALVDQGAVAPARSADTGRIRRRRAGRGPEAPTARGTSSRSCPRILLTGG